MQNTEIAIHLRIDAKHGGTEGENAAGLPTLPKGEEIPRTQNVLGIRKKHKGKKPAHVVVPYAKTARIDCVTGSLNSKEQIGIAN